MSTTEQNKRTLDAIRGGQILHARLCPCGCLIPVLHVRKGKRTIRVDICNRVGQDVDAGALVLTE